MAGPGALPPGPRRGSRWRQPAARAGLVWRLRAKPKPVTPDPAETKSGLMRAGAQDMGDRIGQIRAVQGVEVELINAIGLQ